MEEQRTGIRYAIIFSVFGIVMSGAFIEGATVQNHYLTNHIDVDTTGEINGDVLKFNGSCWIPSEDLIGGGSGGNIFNQDLNTTNNVTFNNITLTLYPNLDKDSTNDFDGTWNSLTGKPIKAHPHNQDLNTTNNVTFNNITLTLYPNLDKDSTNDFDGTWTSLIGKPIKAHPHNQDLNTTNNVVFNTVNTGQGANDLYIMDQNVQTTDRVTFGQIDTGQGMNELYDMNQNVQTTNDVTFNDISISTFDKARAIRTSTTQSSTTWASYVKVSLNGETFDTGSCFDSTTNYRFTAQHTGYYRFSYSVYATNFADRIMMTTSVYKNDSFYGGIERSFSSYASSQGMSNSGSDLVYLTVNTYIDLRVMVEGSLGTWYIQPTYTYLTVERIV